MTEKIYVSEKMHLLLSFKVQHCTYINTSMPSGKFYELFYACSTLWNLSKMDALGQSHLYIILKHLSLGGFCKKCKYH